MKTTETHVSVYLFYIEKMELNIKMEKKEEQRTCYYDCCMKSEEDA